LLELALHVPFGFAGFEAPACLALAESAFVVGPAEADRVQRALRRAAEASHCVQDPALCARVTSRVNALARMWSQQITSPAAAPDLEHTIERFIGSPLAPEFSAVHVVGEAYDGREPPPVHIEIPEWARSAYTLRDLARLYELPLSDFLRLNRHESWEPADVLPINTPVKVPDPEMSSLVAGFLSALAVHVLDPERRVRLIQRLVPAAVTNPGVLDRVLARLLLLAPATPELDDALAAVEALIEARQITKDASASSVRVMDASKMRRDDSYGSPERASRPSPAGGGAPSRFEVPGPPDLDPFGGDF
jgi:hypothetical protein